MVKPKTSQLTNLLNDFTQICNPNSIKGNLLRRLFLGLSLIWLVAMVFASLSIFHETNRQNDIEIQQIASLLSAITDNKDSINKEANTNSVKEIILPKLKNNTEMDAGFAVWDKQGKLLMVSQLGKQFEYRKDFEGFTDSENWWNPKANRILYLQTENGKTLAVGRNWEERIEITKTAILAILLSLLLAIPLFVLLTLLVINKDLYSLQRLSTQVDNRDADDLSPLDEPTSDELKPFTNALNRLFTRVSNTMEQQQRFTSDASHELRSPLSAIKAQADVLMITQDREKQLHHAQKISQSADRATHLVEQLLTLSRLDSKATLLFNEKGHHLKIEADSQSLNHQQIQINWLNVSNQALESVHRLAREKQISLKRHILTKSENQILPIVGDEVLLTIMLRNLLDNAIRYGYDKSVQNNNHGRVVEMTLDTNSICIRDFGKGIKSDNLQRIRERFYRPAGQNEVGSGLGLSIVERIAELHGLEFSLENLKNGGVQAKVALKN